MHFSVNFFVFFIGAEASHLADSAKIVLTVTALEEEEVVVADLKETEALKEGTTEIGNETDSLEDTKTFAGLKDGLLAKTVFKFLRVKCCSHKHRS